MSRFCPLFSSSSGNSVYIGDEHAGVLFDVGRSAKQTREALFAIGIPENAVKAIFITHEHIDHVAGLSVFAAKNDIPVYASAGTLLALKCKGILTAHHRESVVDFNGIEAANMLVTPFRTSHDCAEGLGYTVKTAASTAAILTDTGYLSREMMSAVMGARLLYIESNHDVNMLKNGPYPFALQKRILSDIGHLSNDTCASALKEFVRGGTADFVLAHLSQENNTPYCAYNTAIAALMETGALEHRDYNISIAEPVNTKKPIIF